MPRFEPDRLVAVATYVGRFGGRECFEMEGAKVLLDPEMVEGAPPIGAHYDLMNRVDPEGQRRLFAQRHRPL